MSEQSTPYSVHPSNMEFPSFSSISFRPARMILCMYTPYFISKLEKHSSAEDLVSLRESDLYGDPMKSEKQELGSLNQRNQKQEIVNAGAAFLPSIHFPSFLISFFVLWTGSIGFC